MRQRDNGALIERYGVLGKTLEIFFAEAHGRGP
jgi:hypothetical protein